MNRPQMSSITSSHFRVVLFEPHQSGTRTVVNRIENIERSVLIHVLYNCTHIQVNSLVDDILYSGLVINI